MANLSRKGKAKLKKLKQELPPLNELQNDLLNLLVEEWETLQAASDELQQHIDQQGSMMVTGSTGQSVPHPSFKIKQQAMAHYLKLAQQLRISLANTGEQPPEADEIDALFA